MAPKDFYVYEHWRPDLDVCFYVGKGHGPRAYIFSRRNRYYDNIAKKLAAAGMCVEVRLVRGTLSEGAAFALEKERIAFWRSVGTTLANLTDGGDGISGFKQSPEQRTKIANAQRGRTHSPEVRAKISAAKKGKPGPRRGAKLTQEHVAILVAANTGRAFTDEHRARLSERAKGRPHSSEHKANISAALTGKRYGPLSPEHRAKVSAVHVGSKRSPETRAKISAAQVGRPVSPETREKIRAALLARNRQPA